MAGLKKINVVKPNIRESLNHIEEQRKELEAHEGLLIEKGLHSDNPSDIIKAMEVVKIKQNQGGDYHKTMFIDPLNFNEQFGYKAPPKPVTYGTLWGMSKTPVINSIIKTRKNQVAQFSQPQKDRFSPGFVIRKRNTLLGEENKLNKEEREKIDMITQFILNCGVNQSWSRDDFETFLRKTTEDSLVYDQMTYEVVRAKDGSMYEYMATDSTTMRLSDSYMDDTYAERHPSKVPVAGYFPTYVQMFDERKVAEFYPWELCFGVRNPSTRIYANGYGRSELEDMVAVITSMLWSDEYNRNFFRIGAAPKGILKIKGGSNNAAFQEFRQQWKAMISGVGNCVSGDVVISTKEKGIISVEEYLNGCEEKKATIWIGDSWQDGLVYKTSEHKKYCKTVLSNGDSIVTSPDHKFKVIGDDGELIWKEQKDLTTDDYVLVNRKTSDGDYIPKWNGEEIGEDLMEVLGWQIGDGYMLDNGKHKHIDLYYHHEKEMDVLNSHLSILNKYKTNAELKIKNRTEEDKDKIKVRYGFDSVSDNVVKIQIYNNDFVRWVRELGFNDSKSGKVIPSGIINMPESYICSFLRGYFSADGSNAKRRSPILHVANENLRNQTRYLLNSIGIRCNKGEGKGQGRFGSEINKSVSLSIKDKDVFFSKIGFIQSHKQPLELINVNESCKHNRISQSFIIKHLLNIREFIKTGDLDTCVLSLSERNQINSILIGKDGCSLNRLIRIADKSGYKLPEWTYEYNFEKVDDIVRTDILMPMYDVSINEERHQFMGNNILISNSWRTPIIDSDNMDWIDMQKTQRDMEFGKWQEYLIKIACALYTIDPNEIGFTSGRAEGQNSMFESNNAQKIKYSKDKGLKPLLKFHESKLNKMIVSQIDPEYVLEFVGLDVETEDQYLTRVKDEVQHYKTINEIRKENNLKPIEGGDIVMNTVYTTAQQQSSMMQQQEEMQGQEAENEQMMEEAASEEENPFTKAAQDMIDNLAKGNI